MGRREDVTSCLIVLESTAARYLGLYAAAPDPMPVSEESSVDRLWSSMPPMPSIRKASKGLFSTFARGTRHSTHRRRPMRGVPCRSLAQLLAQSGYRTALFHSGRFEYLGMAPVIADRGFEVLKDAGSIGGNVHSSFGVDEPSTVREMLEWIDALEKGEQFFLMYLPVAGHHPYAAPHSGPFELTRRLRALSQRAPLRRCGPWRTVQRSTRAPAG